MSATWVCAHDDRRLRPITDLGWAHDETTVVICTGAQVSDGCAVAHGDGLASRGESEPAIRRALVVAIPGNASA